MYILILFDEQEIESFQVKDKRIINSARIEPLIAFKELRKPTRAGVDDYMNIKALAYGKEVQSYPGNKKDTVKVLNPFGNPKFFISDINPAVLLFRHAIDNVWNRNWHLLRPRIVVEPRALKKTISWMWNFLY